MKTSEVRRRFLEFFKRKDHKVLRSDSLVPSAGDKSLLFTGAGMNQFKDEFMGRGRPGLKRAATSQKCFRTDDIDEVGRTNFHHTFFEMLGNFSFGDYFKKESILWAWEFMLQEMGVPPERLQVSVYEEDDEAFGIWEREIGLDPKIIHRFSQHDNFWPADAPKLGPNGLCGPCSEIFYDWGEDVGCGKPECNPSCDCGRFSEVWNLVFTQFERKDGGVLEPLPTKNIDTGMGLERMAAVMQGKLCNFDIDIFAPVIKDIERETETGYEAVHDTRQGMAFRRIADHVRAAAFCIGDGVLPGNTRRGYVLRKLIRRAASDGGRLGRKEAFLYRLVPAVAKVMGDQYPDLVERRENIARLIRIEEERFHQTLDQGQGRAMLEEAGDRLAKSGEKTLPGWEAFRLHDTYGIPLDFTEDYMEDRGIQVDREGFEREMEEQRAVSRAASSIDEDIFGSGPAAGLRDQGGTEFVGYEQDEVRSNVVGIISGEELCGEVVEGQEAAIVLDKTPFYGESGGEVGDTGDLESKTAGFKVADTQRDGDIVLHIGTVVSGRIRRGDKLTAKPDAARRAAIRRNHTATHLLHLALREVVGKHAEQSGSLVAPERLRFDFTHMQAMTDEELRIVEDKVNERILRNDPVAWRTMAIDEAKAEGARALFGEKYGEVVRLLDVGGYSKELCGGLHVSATGEIGFFKILSESSVAAGIRRIEAVTGMEAVRFVRAREDLLRSVSAALGAQETRMVERAEQLAAQVKELRKELQRAQQSAGPNAAEYLKNARAVAGTKIVSARIEGGNVEALRALTDQLRQTAPSIAVVLGTAAEDRATLIVALTKDLVEKKLHAGKIAGAAAKLCGGGGGGRPDMAQAGGKDPKGLDDTLQKAEDLIVEGLGGG